MRKTKICCRYSEHVKLRVATANFCLSYLLIHSTSNGIERPIFSFQLCNLRGTHHWCMVSEGKSAQYKGIEL